MGSAMSGWYGDAKYRPDGRYHEETYWTSIQESIVCFGLEFIIRDAPLKAGKFPG